MTVMKLIRELLSYPGDSEVEVLSLYGDDGRRIKGLSINDKRKPGRGKMIIIYEDPEEEPEK